MNGHKFIKNFEIDVINDDQMRKFTCWGSVQVKDRHDEIIPMDEIEKVMDIWMDRGAPIMFNHTHRQIGKGLSWRVSEKDGKPGVLINGIIFKHYKTDDDVWKGIKQGDFEGLSIGGEAHNREQTEEGTYLRKLIGYEFSVVERCGNQEATWENIAMVKNETNDDIKVDKNMKTEDIKKQDDIVSEKPQEEQDLNEVLSGMVAKIEALSARLNEMEEAMSGKPEGEEAVEEKKAEEPEKEEDEEEEEEEDVKKDDSIAKGEEESGEDKEDEKEEASKEKPEEKEDDKLAKLEKSLNAQSETIESLKKALESKNKVSTIVKSERPSESKESNDEFDLNQLAVDIAKGEVKMSFKDVESKLDNVKEAQLKQKLNL